MQISKWVTFFILCCFLTLGCGESTDTQSDSLGDTSLSNPLAGQGYQAPITYPDSDSQESAEPVGNCATNPGVGCPCASGSDCLAGYCLPTQDGLECTEPCESNTCPTDWICQNLDASLCTGDCPPLCVPLGVYLCRPCQKDSECVNPYASGGNQGPAYCLDYGDEGNFCGTGCTTSDECPTGYLCGAGTSINGVTGTQCISQSGQCTCSVLAIDENASTDCVPENSGPGCVGTRMCTENGLSVCAPASLAEICDGLDNDCDGSVDTGACPIGEACQCFGGTCSCVCDPNTETCEGESGGESPGGCSVNGVFYAEGELIACDSDCGGGTMTCAGGTFGPCVGPNLLTCMDFTTCNEIGICAAVCPTSPSEICNSKDDNCDGKVDETFLCTLGEIEQEPCGNSCGTRSRSCTAECGWGPWSSCSGGVCVPGETETGNGSCGNCGTRSRTRACTNECSWGSWGSWSTCTGQGSCAPGATDSCSNCTEKNCTDSCEWTTCTLNAGAGCAWEQGTNFECCGFGQWHFCSPGCEWYPCQSCGASSGCQAECQ